MLGDIQAAQAVKPLSQLLQDEHWQVRFAAVNALGRIRDPQAFEHLTRALDDSEQRVRALASTLLKRRHR